MSELDDAWNQAMQMLLGAETHIGGGTAVMITPCFYCGKPFPCDPDTCPSVLVDVATRKVADHPDATPGLMDDLPRARAEGRVQREAVCPACVQAQIAANDSAGRNSGEWEKYRKR